MFKLYKKIYDTTKLRGEKMCDESFGALFKKNFKEMLEPVMKVFLLLLVGFMLLCFYSQDQEQKRVAEEEVYASVVSEKTRVRLEEEAAKEAERWEEVLEEAERWNEAMERRYLEVKQVVGGKGE